MSISYRTGGSVPQTGSYLLSTVVASYSGDIARQLGVKWVDGEFSQLFVFDPGDATQANVDGEPTVSGDTILVEYPAAAVSDLGKRWTWRSTVTVDGEDVDECPELGDDVTNPKKKTFPS